MTTTVTGSAHRYPVTGPGKTCLVMGVLNVTPDSFSDGGRFATHAAAIAEGITLHRAGADIVDVGGESTRPGAGRTTGEEELRRVLPVIEGLAAAGVVVSIDTMRASVARRAVRAGAVLVNDVSGGRADAAMHRTVAELGVPYVLTHWRAPSRSMRSHARYDDVVREVRDELRAQIDRARRLGVREEQIILDPGLGFAKSPEHNWMLLRELAHIAMGYPLLVGASRKSFLGELLAAPDGHPRGPADRDAASTAISMWAAVQGAWCIRAHDVHSTADAVRVAAKLHPLKEPYETAARR
ncbi:dihydropteroate synthase 1 [Mycobacterium tuberculosis]|nr:dihydropteroate synthase 1 [Mycobacterium tuberculosis]